MDSRSPDQVNISYSLVIQAKSERLWLSPLHLVQQRWISDPLQQTHPVGGNAFMVTLNSGCVRGV